MYRFFSAAVIVATAYFLIATSAPPCSATKSETVMLVSRTTCGPETPVTLSMDTSCNVTLTPADAGLLTSGVAFDYTAKLTLLQRHVELSGRWDPDAGFAPSCALVPDDAGTGYAVSCELCPADGGCACSGTLAP